MVDRDHLARGMEELVSIGPKLTGSEGQARFIDYLKKEISDLGLPVYAEPFFFESWEPLGSSVGLVGEDGETTDAPVSSVYPYSGETPDEGIIADSLFFDGVDDVFSAAGKIVVIRVDDLSAIHSELAFDKRSAWPEDTFMPEFYNGPVATAMVKCLAIERIKALRPAGLILVWKKIPDAAVEGQWLPFIQPRLGIPAVWVNGTVGEKVISHAKKHGRIRLTLTAKRDKYARTESFFTMIPGSEDGECVIINTHTDGPNCVEENGGVALLEMMRQLRDEPLRRTHIFLFTTGHFRLPEFRDIRTGSFQSASKWLAEHRHLWDGRGSHLRCVANLAVEHLGCLEWTVRDGEYVPTGLPEVEMVYTGNDFMDELYINTIKERRKTVRSITLRGHNMLHFGEGQNFFTVGIPGVCLVPGPYYLCVKSDDMQIDRFDLDLMAEQTDTFLCLAREIDATDTGILGRSEGYSFVYANSVSGGTGFKPGAVFRKVSEKLGIKR